MGCYYSYYFKKLAIRRQWRRKEAINMGKGRIAWVNAVLALPMLYIYIWYKPQSQARREIRGSLLVRLREVTYTKHLGDNPKIPDQRAGRIAQNPQGVEAPCEKAVCYAYPEEHVVHSSTYRKNCVCLKHLRLRERGVCVCVCVHACVQTGKAELTNLAPVTWGSVDSKGLADYLRNLNYVLQRRSAKHFGELL